MLQGASVSVGVSPLGGLRRAVAADDARPLPLWLRRADDQPRAAAALSSANCRPAPACRTSRTCKERVQDAIYRVLTYQSSSGSFGLWGPGSGDLWLDSYVTDFLTRAREQELRRAGTGHERRRWTICRTRSPTTSTSRSAATRSPMRSTCWPATSRASVGDLRYYADTKLEAFSSPLARGASRREPRALRRCAALGSGLHRRAPAGAGHAGAMTGRAPTTARRCATARPCWRSPPKASRCRGRAGAHPARGDGARRDALDLAPRTKPGCCLRPARCRPATPRIKLTVNGAAAHRRLLEAR